MRLELKHLAPYLPYGIKIHDGAYSKTVVINHMTYGQYDIGLGRLFNPDYDYKMGLPILRPLSEFNETIWYDEDEYEIHLYKDNYGELVFYNVLDVDEVPIKAIVDLMQELFKMNFDVFGLIEKGLAIDINTIK